MRHGRPLAAVVGLGGFAGLFLVAEDVAFVIAAVVVSGVWIKLVLLGDSERELAQFERTWAPLIEGDDQPRSSSG